MSSSPLVSINMLIVTVLFASLLSPILAGSQGLRALNTKDVLTEQRFNCSGLPAKCDCPYPCLEQYKNENYCIAKKCYEFDKDLGKCKKSGIDHTGPLVLQAIPFTGMFGSGFGNMGRWDIFGMYMGIFFGGCCFIIVSTICCLLCCNNKNDEEATFDDKESCMKCATSCGACMWGTVVVVFWIIGIVQIATEGQVLDSNGCPLIFN
tara:strand:+ start:2523 stop:3143 length:621 start_codon:yes stop_codon:yes gene_type:complete